MRKDAHDLRPPQVDPPRRRSRVPEGPAAGGAHDRLHLGGEHHGPYSSTLEPASRRAHALSSSCPPAATGLGACPPISAPGAGYQTLATRLTLTMTKGYGTIFLLPRQHRGKGKGAPCRKPARSSSSTGSPPIKRSTSRSSRPPVASTSSTFTTISSSRRPG